MCGVWAGRDGETADGMIVDGTGEGAMASGAADRWSPVGLGRHKHGQHQGLQWHKGLKQKRQRVGRDG